jgi:hypothetical protein
MTGGAAMRCVLVGCSFLALSGALFSAQNGGPATLEDVIKETLATLDQLTMSLKTVEDEKSAEAARPELRKAAERFVAVRSKAETMKPPAKEEKERLEKEYKPKLFEAQKKLYGEIGRIKLLPGCQGALKEIRAVVTVKKN